MAIKEMDFLKAMLSETRNMEQVIEERIRKLKIEAKDGVVE